MTHGDYELLRIKYEVVPKPKKGAPDKIRATFHNTLDIRITRSLAVIWGIEGQLLEAQLVEYGKRRIGDELLANTLAHYDAIELSTTNSPDRPPFSVDLEEIIIPKQFEIEA